MGIKEKLSEITGAENIPVFCENEAENNIMLAYFYNLASKDGDAKRRLNTLTKRVNDSKLYWLVREKPQVAEKITEMLENGEDVSETVEEFSKIYSAYETSLNENTDTFDKFAEGYLNPTVDAEKSKLSFPEKKFPLASKLYPQKKQESADIKLNVPEGLSEKDAAMCVFGEGCSKALLEKAAEYSIEIDREAGGNDGVENKLTDNAGITAAFLFDNILGGSQSSRPNQEAFRLIIPDARKNANAVLEQYSAGNKLPFLKSVKNAFDLAYNEAFNSDGKSKNFSSAFNTMQRCFDILSREEYKDITPLKQNDIAAYNYISGKFRVQNDLSVLEKDIKARIAELKFNGSKITPAEDGQLSEMFKRYAVTKAMENKILSNITDFVEVNRENRNNKVAGAENAVHVKNATEELISESYDECFRITGQEVEDRFLTSIPANEFLNGSLEDAVQNLTKFGESVNPEGKLIYGEGFEANHIKSHVDADLGYLKASGGFTVDDNVPVGTIGPDNTICSESLDKLSQIKKAFTNLSFKKNKKQDFGNPDLLKAKIEEYTKLRDMINEAFPNGAVITVDSPDGNGKEYHDLFTELNNGLNVAIKRFKEATASLKTERELSFTAFEQKNKKAGNTVKYYENGVEVFYAKAKEKLLDGGELTCAVFKNGEIFAKEQKISFKSGVIETGKEDKVKTRNIDLKGEKVLNSAERLVQLKQMREILYKSTKGFTKTTKKFDNAFKALDNVIKAQEKLNALGDSANIKQIAAVEQLYAEFDANAKIYVDYKSEQLRPDDKVGKARLDTFKSLRTITDRSTVSQMTEKSFSEKKLLKEQERLMVKNIDVKDLLAKAEVLEKDAMYIIEEDRLLFSQSQRMGDLVGLVAFPDSDAEAFNSYVEKFNEFNELISQPEMKKILDDNKYVKTAVASKIYNCIEAADIANGYPDMMHAKNEANKDGYISRESKENVLNTFAGAVERFTSLSADLPEKGASKKEKQIDAKAVDNKVLG